MVLYTLWDRTATEFGRFKGHNMKKLAELPFIDLYICLDRPETAEYKSSEPGKSKLNHLVPAEYMDDVWALACEIQKELGTKTDGKIARDDLICRLSQRRMTDGSMWVCARRINTKLPNIEDLGIPPHILPRMKSAGKRDGLILISGATGSGKTTTAVALLTYYLNRYGGTAVTLEDPCEFPLHGRHGESGRCFQTEITEESEWATGLKKSLRWGPRYIFVGEVRTPGAAEQLLRAAATGHLVIATLHAGDLIESLRNLSILGDRAMDGDAKDALASCLITATAQTLINGKLQLKFVDVEEIASDPVRAIIRDGKFASLQTQIEQKEARLRNSVGVTVGNSQ